MDSKNKPVIETIINTAAIAMTTLGVIKVQGDQLVGLGYIIFAVGLEFFKYWGRRSEFW